MGPMGKSGDPQPTPEAGGPFAKSIKKALTQTAEKPDAKFLAMGYSPTGGGHTARTLNIVQRALDLGHLKAGDTVIIHAPRPWLTHPRAPGLDDIAHNLKDQGVTVVMAEADKSVMGYLQPEGASDDSKIITGIAYTPRRPCATTDNILNVKIFKAKGDFADLPSISAKDLMKSIQQFVGPDVMHSKFKVLTDMDPALQKAARDVGIPGEQRVDQQNHAILLDTEHVAANLHPKYAHLAKVLGGTGELVSHIDLGHMNTLTAMTALAEKLKLTESSTKRDALLKVAQYLLDHGAKEVNPGQNFEGVIPGKSISAAKDVENIVYIYAHNFTPTIEDRIRARIEAQDPAYNKTLFLFCGAKAVKDANAMHLAYLADGDGITTAGAGSTGEFSYLHKCGGAKAGLLLLPIARHIEQVANARSLAADSATKDFVMNHSGGPDLASSVDPYIKQRAAKAGTKYCQGTLSTMLKAVGDKSDCAQQAVDLLFAVPGAASKVAQSPRSKIEDIERLMRSNPVLKANRQFDKIILQVLGQLQAPGDRPLNQPFVVMLRQKKGDNSKLTFNNLHELAETIGDNTMLTALLNCSEPLSEDNVPPLKDTREFLKDYLADNKPGATDAADLTKTIATLKNRFGCARALGF